MTTHEHTTHNQIGLDIGGVFLRTSKRFEKVFLPILLLQITALLIAVFSVLIIGGVLGAFYAVLPASLLSTLFLGILGTLALGVILWVFCAVPIMSIHILQSPSYEYQTLFKKSLKQVPRVFTISALISLAVIGGLLLGILPGLWLALVLEFVFIILVLEHKTHKEVIAQSAYLVKGNFWNVAVNIAIIVVLSMFLGAIPFVGILLSIVLAIFSKCLTFELYKTLTHNKVHDASVKHTNKKLVNAVYALAAFGIMAIIVIITAVVFLVGLATAKGNINAGINAPIDSQIESLISESQI